MTMKTLPLGTISHGTMRPEDLIPAFLDALESVEPEHELVAEWGRMIDQFSNGMDVDGYEHRFAVWYLSDLSGYFLEELFDALNEHCPLYCYFGAHEGDGSDYGVWISWDAVDLEFPASGYGGDEDCIRINTGEPWPMVEQILEVNDHGNATLWIWDAEEHKHVVAWEVV